MLTICYSLIYRLEQDRANCPNRFSCGPRTPQASHCSPVLIDFFLRGIHVLFEIATYSLSIKECLLMSYQLVESSVYLSWCHHNVCLSLAFWSMGQWFHSVSLTLSFLTWPPAWTWVMWLGQDYHRHEAVTFPRQWIIRRMMSVLSSV